MQEQFFKHLHDNTASCINDFYSYTSTDGSFHTHRLMGLCTSTRINGFRALMTSELAHAHATLVSLEHVPA